MLRPLFETKLKKETDCCIDSWS